MHSDGEHLGRRRLATDVAECRNQQQLTFSAIFLFDFEPDSEDTNTTIQRLRIRLQSTAGLTLNQLQLDRLPVYLQGGEVAAGLYERLIGATIEAFAQPVEKWADRKDVLPALNIRQMGFDRNEALLPLTDASLDGYRLSHEYFAFPERFLFVELMNLKRSFRKCADSELDLIFLFDKAHPRLDKTISASNFGLFCTPAINLFLKDAERIDLSYRTGIHRIVPDRDKPDDFEAYGVEQVTGYGDSAEPETVCVPYYEPGQHFFHRRREAYYTLSRELHQSASTQLRIDRLLARRSPHTWNDVYISLLDIDGETYDGNAKALDVKMLCSNRDLPLKMVIGEGKTDFTLVTGGPVTSIRCLSGPTPPRTSSVHGKNAWRLISQFNLNYLSLVDNDEDDGAAALRDILMLYAYFGERVMKKQVEALLSISCEPRMGEMPGLSIPPTFRHGIEITITLDESKCEGYGAFLFGAVLEQFFRRYVSSMSFTETIIRTVDRGEIMRWPTRVGTRHRL